jgi:glycosyltransferase involved in cell wall biosynthesis
MLIVDDASTDKSSKIIKEYQKKYPDKIEATFHQENHGRGKESLMDANLKVDSHYIAYLEGDDYWCDESKIEIQIDFLEDNPDFVGCCHATRMINLKTKEETIIRPGLEEWSLMDVIKGNSVTYCHTSSYIRRNIFKGTYPDKFVENREFDGDTMQGYAFLAHGKDKYFDKIMSVYNLTGIGEWSRKSKEEQTLEHIKMTDTLNRYFDYKYDELFQIQKKRWKQCLKPHLEESNLEKIKKYIKTILKKFHVN